MSDGDVDYDVINHLAVAFRCPECGCKWTVADDPNEWAYGHDCES